MQMSGALIELSVIDRVCQVASLEGLVNLPIGKKLPAKASTCRLLRNDPEIAHRPNT